MQITNKITLMYPLSVLIIGLISCSPEQKPQKDSLKIQEPEIITERGLSAKVTNLEANFSWSIKDRIHFKEPNRDGLRLAVKSSCSSAQGSYEDSHIRPLPEDLPIAEILPVTLLTRKNPLQENQFLCSFNFAIINNNGSQHKFKLPARLVTEIALTNYQATLQMNGSPLETKANEWPQIDSLNLEKFWVSSPRANQFQLNCTDLRIFMTAKSDLISVNEIVKNQGNEKVYISKLRAPLQSCRILTFQNGILNGWSPYFKILWSDAKLNIQVTKHFNPVFWPETVVGTTHKIYEAQIKNSYSFPVYFSIPDQKDIWVFSMQSPQGGFKFKLPFSIEFDKSTPGLILNEKNPNRIGLSPGAQIVFQLKFRFTRICRMNAMAYTFPFQSLANLKIKRFLNMNEDTDVGAEDLVPPRMISTVNGHVSGFSLQVPPNFDPPGC